MFSSFCLSVSSPRIFSNSFTHLHHRHTLSLRSFSLTHNNTIKKELSRALRATELWWHTTTASIWKWKEADKEGGRRGWWSWRRRFGWTTVGNTFVFYKFMGFYFYVSGCWNGEVLGEKIWLAWWWFTVVAVDCEIVAEFLPRGGLWIITSFSTLFSISAP